MILTPSCVCLCSHLHAHVISGKAEMFWYSTIQVGADVKKDDKLASLLSSRTYMSVRCIKK